MLLWLSTVTKPVFCFTRQILVVNFGMQGSNKSSTSCDISTTRAYCACSLEKQCRHCPDMYVLNGELQENPPQTASALLLQLPRGPYTCTVASKGLKGVSLWQQHCERLAYGLTKLSEQDSSFRGLQEWLQDLRCHTSKLPNTVQSLVQPSLSLALDSLRAPVRHSQRVMVTVLLFPSEQRVGGVVPLNVAVHACCFTPLAAARSADVAVVGGPRQFPTVKDSLWLRHRKAAEAILPSGFAEGLLCSHNGQLLEGLVTNFFVVRDDAEGNPEVLTAATEDGVLGGIMRAEVLRVFARLGIRCWQTAPCIADRHQWKEAFLTNMVRRVQPVHSIHFLQPELFGGKTWVVNFPPGPGVVTLQLLSALNGEDPVINVHPWSAQSVKSAEPDVRH